MPSFDYSQFLTQAAADARYQALGSLGSSTPSTIDPDDAGSAGVSTSAARQGHEHPITTAVPVAIGAALAEGVATSFARSDHVHTGPLGTLGYAQVVSGQLSISSEVDLTGLAVTVTVQAGRRIRITGSVSEFDNDANAGAITGRIKEGSTGLGMFLASSIVASGFVSAWGSVVITPTQGAHTYKLSAQKSVGAGTVSLFAAATQPAFILVEDIGAA